MIDGIVGVMISVRRVRLSPDAEEGSRLFGRGRNPMIDDQAPHAEPDVPLSITDNTIAKIFCDGPTQTNP
jgi:hypothetical protein